MDQTESGAGESANAMLVERDETIARLTKERDEALAALEAFDDMLGEEDEYGDDRKAVVTIGRSTYHSLTLGDFRRARRVRRAQEGTAE